MDKADIQSRRADNQIWNGALEYGFTPDFCAYDSGGEAELYLNTVIGLAYRIFDFNKFMPLLNTFQSQADGAAYSALFWLGIEGAVYSRAGAGRPALAELRREYASRVLSGTEKKSAYESVERLRTAWMMRRMRRRHCGKAGSCRCAFSPAATPSLTGRGKYTDVSLRGSRR